MTDLVFHRLPIHLPEIPADDPRFRGAWDVVAPAMLVRASTTVRALFKLDPDDSWLATEAIARTVIELVITFSWLAADPDQYIPEWVAGNDLERSEVPGGGVASTRR